MPATLVGGGGPPPPANTRPAVDAVPPARRDTRSTTSIECPRCGHTSTTEEVRVPDPSVVRWFRSAPAWSGTLSTDEVHGQYLTATGGAPVSRNRFVSDLAHLGVEEVLDDDVLVLDRR